MASKNESAFTLLQIYDDDDDDIEDTDNNNNEDDDNNGDGDGDGDYRRESIESNPGHDVEGSIPSNDINLPIISPPLVNSPTIRPSSANSTPNRSNLRPPMIQKAQKAVAESDGMRQRRVTPSIVDYGHDDVALSPEPEEGEILSATAARAMFREEHDSSNGIPENTPTVNVQALTPHNQINSPQQPVQDVPSVDGMNDGAKESDGEFLDEVNVSNRDAKQVDPLDKFLPPSPLGKCPNELQEKINKFLAYKRQGKIFNVEVRNRKDYRNPDFLRHAVRYQEIDEIGSNFSKDVFDPHGYDKSDFYDGIEADMKREMERKEQERKKSQKVEFVSGGTQAAIATSAQKVALSSVLNLPSGALSGSTDAGSREGRQNKKSKWDKVDGDRRNLLSGGQDSISAVGAHAALLSAANAGAGYANFVQQKRREAEEKRLSDKKMERRS